MPAGRRHASGERENLRIVSSGPSSASGGSTAFTRLPSGRRASTIGLDSSTRRPTELTTRSITWRRCSSSRKAAGSRTSRPPRSVYTARGAVRDHLGHPPVAEQRLERPHADRVVDDACDEPTGVGRIEQQPVAANEIPRRPLGRGAEIARRGPVTQLATEPIAIAGRQIGDRIAHTHSSAASSRSAAV